MNCSLAKVTSTLVFIAASTLAHAQDKEALRPDAGKPQEHAETLQTLMDRAAIVQVVQDWALARDGGDWDKLRSTFTSDGTMYTTWFAGSADEFVRRSRDGAKRPTRSQHFIGASSIKLEGDRAIAETRMTLLLRGPLQGVEVDVTSYGRFYDFFVREGGRWRISKRMPIYERDRLEPVNPSARIELDVDELARYPEGYRHLAYLQSRGGTRVTEGLVTPGSEALARLYAEGAAWLAHEPVTGKRP